MEDKIPNANEFYSPPPKRSEIEDFKLFLWNPDKKQFLGRTAYSWGRIGLFYLIFYISLVAFFMAMLWVFYQTLDNDIPRWQGENSRIGANPGLGFRPMPSPDNIDSTLIWFKHGEAGNWHYWTNELTEFLKQYEHPPPNSGESITNCAFGEHREENQACPFNLEEFGKGQSSEEKECFAAQDYGYKLGKPCIVIKLNKIYGWIPDVYKNSSELPSSMPAQLKQQIQNIERNDPKKMDMVWLSCEGENPADKENIGPLNYYPWQGFPGYYYPFKNARGYVSPIVMVQFRQPSVGVLINIECKAWAKNIKSQRTDRRGSIHFELMMD